MAEKLSIRKLEESDLDALYRIREIAFLDQISRTNKEAQAQHRALLPYRYGRFRGDTLLGSACWYPFSAYIGGEPQTIGALASVVSAVTSRGQGHVRALLGDGLKRLHEEGVGWSLEYPFDTRYYRKYGWETVSNGHFVEVPIERFSRFKRPAQIERYDELDAPAMAHLARIYQRWAASYNFTLTRDHTVRPDWQYVLKGTTWEPVGRPQFVFATPEAYIVVNFCESTAQTRLFVSDYAFESPQGRRDMLGFMNHFAGQADVVRIQLPQDDPLLAEWSNFGVPHPHPLQARIVDAAAALSGWKSRAAVDFRVQISDSFCPWNDGIFEVSTHQGETRATRIQAKPQVQVDVRGLSKILSGSVSQSAAKRCGLISGEPEAIAAICGLNINPCFMAMADYF